MLGASLAWVGGGIILFIFPSPWELVSEKERWIDTERMVY